MSTRGTRSGLNVLIVDQRPGTAEALRQQLRDAGAAQVDRARICTTLDEAVSHVARAMRISSNVDLLVLGPTPPGAHDDVASCPLHRLGILSDQLRLAAVLPDASDPPRAGLADGALLRAAAAPPGSASATARRRSEATRSPRGTSTGDAAQR